MISTKKLFTLTLAALLLAWVSHWASQGRDSGQDARIGQTLIQADLVDQMDGLSIQRGSVTLKLKRIGGGWKILSKGGYPANSAKLISLMQKIGTARINSLVSMDPSRQLDFDLQDPATNQAGTGGVSLILYEGTAKLAHLIFGRSRGGGLHGQGGQYDANGGDPNSYLIQQNLELLYMDQDWMQTRLWSLNPDQVQALQLELGETSLNLARKTAEKPFQTKGGAPASAKQILRIIENLSNLNILDAYPPAELEGKPLNRSAKLLLTLFEGQALALELWEWPEEEEQRFFLKILPAPNPSSAQAFGELFELAPHWFFEVAEWQIEDLLKLGREVKENPL